MFTTTILAPKVIQFAVVLYYDGNRSDRDNCSWVKVFVNREVIAKYNW